MKYKGVRIQLAMIILFIFHIVHAVSNEKRHQTIYGQNKKTNDKMVFNTSDSIFEAKGHYRGHLNDSSHVSHEAQVMSTNLVVPLNAK